MLRKVGPTLPLILGGALSYYVCQYPGETDRGPHLPKHVQYLLIGDTTEVFSAAQAIRACDVSSKVVVVCPGDHPPCIREAFPREFIDLKRAVSGTPPPNLYTTFRRLFFEKPSFFMDVADYDGLERGALFMANGLVLDEIDIPSKRAKFGDVSVDFDRCFVSPCSARQILGRDSLSGFDDFLRIFKGLPSCSQVIIRGSTELAAQMISILQTHPDFTFRVSLLRQKGKFLLSDYLPLDLAEIAEKELEKYGLDVVVLEDGDIGVHKDGNRVCVKAGGVTLAEGDLFIDAEPVVAQRDIFGGGGEFVVDEHLRVGCDVWAAGDGVSADSRVFGRRRFRGYDNAFMSGRLAGVNMAGGERLHEVVPMMWLYLGPVELEGCGVVDSRLETLCVFEDDSAKSIAERSGVIYYVEGDGTVVGVCLWNPSGSVTSNLLRRLVATGIHRDNVLSATKIIHLFEDDAE